MRKIKLLAVFAIAFTLTMAPALTNFAVAASQTKCPVMGAKIDPKVYSDYKGKRIYFCCAECKGQFEKDPEKYLKKMEAEKVEPAPIPAK